MDRDTLGTAVLAVVGVLAVALTAATLPTAVQPERSGSGGSGAGGTGDGTGGPTAPPSVDPPDAVIDLPFLEELALAFGVALALLALWHLYHNWRRAFRTAVALLVAGAVFALLWELFPFEPSSVTPPAVSPFGGNASGGGGGSGDPTTDPPVLAVVLVLALVAAVVGAVLTGRTKAAAGQSDTAEETADATDVAAVGQAAGRAADRIESGDDVDNEVYRAWREMTSLLDVPRPETQTAGEFETAAVEAGMDPADVGELTTLFESVRYGGQEARSTDERRAVELLRRIEERYSEGEP